MKKSLSLLLTFILSFIVVGSRFIKSNETVPNSFVYAEDADGNFDGFEEGDDPENVPEMIHRLCQTYGVTIYSSGSLYGWIIGDGSSLDCYIEDSDDNATFEISRYEVEGENYIDITYSDNNSEYLTFMFTEDLANFSGNVIVDGEEINIYDIEDEEESAVIALSNDNVKPQLLGFLSIKILKFTVLAVVIAVTSAYATYLVNNFRPLGDYTRSGVAVVHENIKYSFANLKSKIADRVDELLREHFEHDDEKRFYIAIPITDRNRDIYVKKCPNLDIESGDMLLSEYPLSFQKVKKFIRKGYSVYTFEAVDAHHVLKATWIDGFVKEEPCNKGFKKGFYSHYHAYDGLGQKRMGIILNYEDSIHGFYGLPWSQNNGH